MQLTITTIGNSEGIILPKEMLARMRAGKGDKLYITETPDGGFKATPYDPVFAKAMEIAEEIMRDHRDVLKKLAE